ncbi:MAG: S8/S53 family peptidase [Bacteroidota bacterium]
MKKHLLLWLCLLGGASFLFAQSPERISGQVLVQFAPDVRPDQWIQSSNSLRTAKGSQHLRQLHAGANMHLLAFDETNVDPDRYLAQLRASPLVLHAQFNHLLEYRGLNPDDNRYDEQWALRKIEAPDAWEVTTGGRTSNGDTIVVAVMDGGCQLDHEDLVDNLWRNHGEIPDDEVDNDGNGYTDDYFGLRLTDRTDDHFPHNHGTRVAGIVGATGDNGIGITGVNWEVKLMILSEVRSEDQVVEAMMYTHDMRKLYNETNGAEGAFVVAANYSLGIDQGDCVNTFTMWNPTLDMLGSVGILVIGATADQNWDVDELGDIPTTCTSDFMVAVTNTDQMDNKVISAAYGPKSVDLGAPGNGTITTSPGDAYWEEFGGTSAAAPHVAGAIGLLYSYPCEGLARDAINRPQETALLMKEVLIAGVDPTPALNGRTVSGGRLNVLQSMALLEAHYGQERGPLGFVRTSPNPTSNELTISVSLPDFTDYELKIYDSDGRRVLIDQIPGRCTAPLITLDVSGLVSGVYSIVIENPDNFETAKFVVH